MIKEKSNISLLFAFAHRLVTITERHILNVWDPSTACDAPLDSIELPDTLTPCCVAHPATYVNKILIGTREGIQQQLSSRSFCSSKALLWMNKKICCSVVAHSLGIIQLWNIQTRTLLYTFTAFEGNAITCMEEAPALDVIAIGFMNGKIILHHLQQDKSVAVFTQAEGVVTSLSFRTDAPMLASGATNGSIVLWNLKEKRVHTTISRAHENPITSLGFLPEEPVLVSAGTDNCIKVTIQHHDEPLRCGFLINLMEVRDCYAREQDTMGLPHKSSA